MSLPGQYQRFVGKVSATLELTCFGQEISSITELLKIQPTWTSPLTAGKPWLLPSSMKDGCVWHYDTASSISSTSVSDHVQQLLALFLPIKSRLEEIIPTPHIKVSIHWECSALGVTGITGPQLSVDDLKGIVELGAELEIKVTEKDEITDM